MKNSKEKGKKMTFRLLNVVIVDVNKQSPDNYTKLFQYAFEHSEIVKIVGDNRMKFHSLSISQDCVFGDIAHYIKLSSKEWYDEANNSAIVDVPIDENLGPNLRLWQFFFYPNRHCLAIPTANRASFGQMTTYFKFVLSIAASNLGMGEVKCDVISTKECIEDIFSLDSFDSLSIEVHGSNNDNNDAAERLIDEEIKSSGVDLVTTKMQSSKEKSFTIKRDGFFGSMLSLARRNGNAVAKGERDNRRVTIKTSDYPTTLIVNGVTSENILSKVVGSLHEYFRDGR